MHANIVVFVQNITEIQNIDQYLKIFADFVYEPSLWWKISFYIESN